MMDCNKEWALALFKKSVLKKEKYRQIVSMIDNLDGKICLDIGADNGVISLLLREQGGTWCSADLEENTVESIRQLVEKNVFQIDGLVTPFPRQKFDIVIIIDFLEHIHTDREFISELKRIMKPGGELVINVPHLKPYSLLNRLRNVIGLTDEKHGHVRPGYSRKSLMALLEPDFTIKITRTYSKTFSEMIDTGLNFLYEILQKIKNQKTSSIKGTVVTKSDLEKNKKEFVVLSFLFPFLWLVSQLDYALFMQQGYKLILKASLNTDINIKG